MFWNENMIYRCFSQRYEENMFLIMQKLQIDCLSQPFLMVGTKDNRSYNSGWSPFVTISLLAVGWVTNVINSKYTLGVYAVFPQWQMLCYQTINPCTFGHISIDFQELKSHSMCTCSWQNVYNSVLQWTILFYYFMLKMKENIYKNNSQVNITFSWNWFISLSSENM